MMMIVSADRFGAKLLAALALLPLSGCSSSATSSSQACEQPQTTGNIVECSAGWSHRASAAACSTPPPPSNEVCMVDPDVGGSSGCMVDADCTAKPFGRCGLVGNDALGEWCECDYGCVTDADCGQNQVCICSGSAGGYCAQSDCKTDADCGSGLLCASDPGGGCSEFSSSVGFSCQTPEDECMTDADCPNGWCVGGTYRRCEQGDPCEGVGRPFLIDGGTRRAPLAARADWQAHGFVPDMADLDAEARTALATRWAVMGAMEHASVAAFARFVLQLLSVGAPPDLIRDAQTAMADETRHAELCYALASAYATTPLGPGALDIDRALASNGPRDILITTIHEGCVGETVAALEAEEMAARADDPAVRAVLEEIAADESRHAELAYRFVRWALGAFPDLTSVARAAFDDALATPARADGGDDDGALVAHGFAGNKLRREIRSRALAGAVAPCARALLARADMTA